tara:strand:+ start:6936 stop:7574 length:639 start_codon:yes stop_codon:yes gene_type:complete
MDKSSDNKTKPYVRREGRTSPTTSTFEALTDRSVLSTGTRAPLIAKHGYEVREHNFPQHYNRDFYTRNSRQSTAVNSPEGSDDEEGDSALDKTHHGSDSDDEDESPFLFNPREIGKGLSRSPSVDLFQDDNQGKNGGGRRKWSMKYKKSINCKRPRGFSQKQYCKYGRKKTRKGKHLKKSGKSKKSRKSRKSKNTKKSNAKKQTRKRNSLKK